MVSMVGSVLSQHVNGKTNDCSHMFMIARHTFVLYNCFAVLNIDLACYTEQCAKHLNKNLCQIFELIPNVCQTF